MRQRQILYFCPDRHNFFHVFIQFKSLCGKKQASKLASLDISFSKLCLRYAVPKCTNYYSCSISSYYSVRQNFSRNSKGLIIQGTHNTTDSLQNVCRVLCVCLLVYGIYKKTCAPCCFNDQKQGKKNQVTACLHRQSNANSKQTEFILLPEERQHLFTC